MKALEAKQVARSWLLDEWLPSLERDHREAVLGAYVMGSLAARANDEPFNESASDIDVAIVVDERVLPADRARYPHGKFLLHGECAVQAIFVGAARIEDERSLLTMLGLGCNLRHGHILSDPEGKIAAAQQLVLERWGDQQWVASRTARAVEFVRGAVAAMAGAGEALSQLATLCEVVSQLAGVVAISRRVTPTHRRALAVASPLLEADGGLDLYERLLWALGADTVDELKITEATSDAVTAATMEAELGGGADMSEVFRAKLPRLAEAGVAEMIHDGLLREAMLPALSTVADCGAAVSASGRPHRKQEIEALVVKALRRHVRVDEEEWSARVGFLERLTDDFSEFVSV